MEKIDNIDEIFAELEVQTDTIKHTYIESAQSIVKENINRIYKLPKKYKNLHEVLEDYELLQLLRKIFNFIKDKKIIIYKRKYCFFLDNNKLTGLRKKTSTGVTNRYTNYLCAIGFIKKVPQYIEDAGYRNYLRMSKINREIYKQNKDKHKNRRAINTYAFKEYTNEYLAEINARAGELIKNGVTPHNISFNLLCAKGLEDIAHEVYPTMHENVYAKKERELKKLLTCIDNLCEVYGYTTKDELSMMLDMPRTDIDKLFRIFKDTINERYLYKAPNRIEKDTFDLQTGTWIVVPRQYQK